MTDLRQKISWSLLDHSSKKVAVEAIRRIVLFGKEKGRIKPILKSKPLPTPKAFAVPFKTLEGKALLENWLKSNLSPEEKLEAITSFARYGDI